MSVINTVIGHCRYTKHKLTVIFSKLKLQIDTAATEGKDLHGTQRH